VSIGQRDASELDPGEMKRGEIAIQNCLQPSHLRDGIKLNNATLQLDSTRHYDAIKGIDRVDEFSLNWFAHPHAEAFHNVQAERNTISDGQWHLESGGRGLEIFRETACTEKQRGGEHG